MVFMPPANTVQEVFTMDVNKIEIRTDADEKQKDSEADAEKEQVVGEYQRAQIKDMASTTTRSGKGVIHCLTIIGQIEGHQILPQETKSTKYEHVMPQLAAIEESDEIEGRSSSS